MLSRRHVFPLLALLLVASHSFAQSAKTKFDKTADFSSYKTWAWKADPHPDGKTISERYQAWEKGVVIQIEEEIKLKGLELKSETEASLLLTRIVQVEERTAETGSAYPGSGARGVGAKGTKFRELTVVIDMIDAKTGKSVWNGKSVTEVDSMDELGQRIVASMQKLFKKYPPEKK